MKLPKDEICTKLKKNKNKKKKFLRFLRFFPKNFFHKGLFLPFISFGTISRKIYSNSTA